MIDGSEKRNRQLAFELQNTHVCEKRNKKITLSKPLITKGILKSVRKKYIYKRFTVIKHNFIS